MGHTDHQKDYYSISKTTFFDIDIKYYNNIGVDDMSFFHSLLTKHDQNYKSSKPMSHNWALTLLRAIATYKGLKSINCDKKDLQQVYQNLKQIEKLQKKDDEYVEKEIQDEMKEVEKLLISDAEIANDFVLQEAAERLREHGAPKKEIKKLLDKDDNNIIPDDVLDNLDAEKYGIKKYIEKYKETKTLLSKLNNDKNQYNLSEFLKNIKALSINNNNNNEEQLKDLNILKKEVKNLQIQNKDALTEAERLLLSIINILNNILEKSGEVKRKKKKFYRTFKTS